MTASTSLLYLLPPVAVFIAWVWLGELPFASELLGGGVVLLGVITIGVGDRMLGRLRRAGLPAT